jgi:monovalent cation:H+ antiporter-2, CPA2 family
MAREKRAGVNGPGCVGGFLFARMHRSDRTDGSDLKRQTQSCSPESPREAQTINQHSPQGHGSATMGPRAIIVGYGPVGRTSDKLLRDAGYSTTIIDMNIDTVRQLHADGRAAIFGDSAREEVLATAGIASADYLIVTLPESHSRDATISTARHLRPECVILARGRYIQEKERLLQAGATEVCIEESEVATALARLAHRRIGTPEDMISMEVSKLRRDLNQMIPRPDSLH